MNILSDTTTQAAALISASILIGIFAGLLIWAAVDLRHIFRGRVVDLDAPIPYTLADENSTPEIVGRRGLVGRLHSIDLSREKPGRGGVPAQFGVISEYDEAGTYVKLSKCVGYDDHNGLHWLKDSFTELTLDELHSLIDVLNEAAREITAYEAQVMHDA